MKYTLYIKTHRELIYSSKHLQTSCRPRMFLPTIDIFFHLVSTIGHPQDKAMNSQGWVLGQI
jgi:hypothetical protein